MIWNMLFFFKFTYNFPPLIKPLFSWCPHFSRGPTSSRCPSFPKTFLHMTKDSSGILFPSPPPSIMIFASWSVELPGAYGRGPRHCILNCASLEIVPNEAFLVKSLVILTMGTSSQVRKEGLCHEVLITLSFSSPLLQASLFPSEWLRWKTEIRGDMTCSVIWLY